MDKKKTEPQETVQQPTLEQLKATAYDVSREINRLSAILQQIENSIRQRSAEETT